MSPDDYAQLTPGQQRDYQMSQQIITAEEIQAMLEQRGCIITKHVSFHADHRHGYIGATDPKDGLQFELSYEYDTVLAIEQRIRALFGEKDDA